MTELMRSPLGWLRITGYLEGSSFLLLLFVTMPLKYYADFPRPNQIIGMVHGVLFIIYVLLVLYVRAELKWKFGKTFFALLASVIPFGPFIADRKLFRESKDK